MITIEVDGEDFEVPSSAADTNWATNQVAFEQAVVTYVDDVNTAQEADEAAITALSAAVKPTAVVGTAGSGTGISAASTSYGRNTVHQITVGYTALNNASSVDILLWTLPAKTRIERVVADVATAFEGPAAGPNVKVGASAGNDGYLKQFDATSSTQFGLAQADLGNRVVGGTGFATDMTWGTTTVYARFTGTGLTDAFVGSVTFYIECVTYP